MVTKVVSAQKPSLSGSVSSRGSNQYFQGVSGAESEDEKMVREALVVNSMNHPIELSYNGEGMMLSPHARKIVADWQKLGAIPKGVVVIPKTK